MAYTYAFADADSTSIKRTDADGNVAFVPTAAGNRDYAAYLASGVTASAYVAPAPAAPLTPAEKLANAGLTADELKTLLGI
tara:strand:+ start:266 stop:508 length:243 start_codon:yes stop_codon:yes gene_type:complete